MATLLSLVEGLARDPAAKAAYASDPASYLARNGFEGLEPADVSEALAHAADALPPQLAVHIDAVDGLDGLAALDPHSLALDADPLGIGLGEDADADGSLESPIDPFGSDDAGALAFHDAPAQPAAGPQPDEGDESGAEDLTDTRSDLATSPTYPRAADLGRDVDLDVADAPAAVAWPQPESPGMEPGHVDHGPAVGTFDQTSPFVTGDDLAGFSEEPSPFAAADDTFDLDRSWPDPGFDAASPDLPATEGDGDLGDLLDP